MKHNPQDKKVKICLLLMKDECAQRKGLAAVSSSFFAALYSAFGKYDVVHIHAEGPAFFSWLPKILGKRVVVTIHGTCEIIWITRKNPDFMRVCAA